MSEVAKNLMILLAAGLFLVGALGHRAEASQAAIVVAFLATAAQWPRLPRLGRAFFVAALLAAPAVVFAFPARIAEVEAALVQGVAFTVLLSTIGVMRVAVKRSRIAAEATRWIVSVPGRSRYAAINVGAHFLSLLFNIGIVALIGELLGGDRDRRMSPDQHRHLLLAGVRGTVLMTVWSPMGIGFAIVTTGIVGLDPLHFLGISFLVAVIFLAVTCALFGRPPEGAETEAPRPLGSHLPVLAIVGVSLLLLAATVGLHRALHVGFIVAAAVVLPLFSGLWVMIEPVPEAEPPRAVFAAMLRGLSDMRGESAIFLSANVIGAAISIVLREQPLWATLQSGAWPDLWIIGACLLVVPLAGALMIPHSIFVVLVVQLFGSGAAGHQHPTTLALALTLGWAMAITVSPISALSLITGNLGGVSSHVVGFVWNGRFFATLMALSVTVVLATYGLGW